MLYMSTNAHPKFVPPSASLLPPRARLDAATSDSPVDSLVRHLSKDRRIWLTLSFLDRIGKETHLKDLTLEDPGNAREATMEGQSVINFGFSSPLGLDRNPAVQQAIIDGMRHWGTQNTISRSFASAEICKRVERRLADWLGVEDTMVVRSVSIANIGVIPAICGPDTLLAVDQFSHTSIWEASKIAQADGVEVQKFDAAEMGSLEEVARKRGNRRLVVAIDGVYSMLGTTPPLQEVYDIAKRHDGVLYVDDAHGTGAVGPGGRGAAFETLGSVNDIVLAGSLSKAFGCVGGFVTCTHALKLILKMKNFAYIFCGPVPSPYLAGVEAALDILESPEFDALISRLQHLIHRLTSGLDAAGIRHFGNVSPIVAIPIGDIEETLMAGRYLFDRGYYVPSVTYPAVPINGGLLRIQVSANNHEESIDGLVATIAEMKENLKL